ncbi:MAG: hypothetical protein Q8M29_08775 [Bacteroidota bacterium]|nr:hypothetical protein [Bacteroidota bacterium]
MKKLALLLLITILLFGCGSKSSKSSSDSNETPTNFTTCDELNSFVQYYSYSDLKAKWGEGKIDEPWDESGVGEMKMKVNVTWSNILCNGKPVTIMFTNAHSGIADAFEKTPNLFDGIFCDNYK